MIFLFWISTLFIIYTYIGYVCVIWFLAKVKQHKVAKRLNAAEKKVSIVISVYNEELHIVNKINDLTQQKYNPENIEIIIVSDGSTDSTNELVENFIDKISNSKQGENNSPLIKLIKVKPNQGKPNALNVGIHEANGEIIIFSDVRQAYNQDAIRELVANFNDPHVGSVSGELVFVKKDTGLQIDMGAYWEIEKLIRKKESETGSAVGATGAIYAIRKSLFRNIPKETLIDDVMIPMNIVLQGYRNIFDSKAIAYDTVSENDLQEKRRKIRTLLGNYQLVTLMPELLSPNKNPIFFRFVSHKLLRLFVPFFFILFLISAFFANGNFYTIVFILTILATFISFFNKQLKHMPIIGKIAMLIYTFLSLNYFAFIAFCYFLIPGKRRIW